MTSLSYVSDEYLLSLSEEEFLYEQGVNIEKFFLGTICNQGHDWMGTGRSLKVKCNNQCTECRGTKFTHDYKKLILDSGLNPEDVRVGALCPKNHDWANTGMSLKYSRGGACLECAKLKKLEQKKNKNIVRVERTADALKDIQRILEDHGVDQNVFTLGGVCSKNHRFSELGYSLRYKNKTTGKPTECVSCRSLKYTKREKFDKDNPETQAILNSYNIPTDRYYLGRICIHGHDWNDTGYSLRFYKNSACCGCVNLQKPGYTREQFLEDRKQLFWDSVNIIDDEDSCWDWKGHVDDKGYGKVTYLSKQWKSHRVAFTLSKGEIPEGMVVMHSCDRPSCNRPSHLSLGTMYDNVHDMLNKGRGNKPYGEKHGMAKLTESDVRRIRQLYSTGEYTMKKIGEMIGISPSSVGLVVRNKIWKHLD